MAKKARTYYNNNNTSTYSYTHITNTPTNMVAFRGMALPLLLSLVMMVTLLLPPVARGAAAVGAGVVPGQDSRGAAAAAGVSKPAGRDVGPGGHKAEGGPVQLSEVDGKSLFRSLRASSCSVDCSTATMEYVCGTDGVSYTSRCELQRAKQCDGKRALGARVKVRSKGSCPGDTTVMSKCFQERQEARKVARRESSDVLIPSCNADGTYSEVQCHKTTGYCWCVTKDGRHIPGTSVLERRPRCKGRRRKRKGRNSKKKKKRKAACTNKERQSFNSELVGVFRDEYEMMLSARGPEAVNDAALSDDDVSIEKKIVVWKFSQLDTNADGMLSFKEIRSFRRMVKKLIKPRRCAKRFHRYCDKNHDRRIEKKEWTLCLGVDIKLSFRIFIALNSDGQTTDNPSDKPIDDSSKKNCLEERQVALLHDDNIYIPRCQDNGLWRQAQCHEATQYCWCVDETSGNPIPGTATHRVEPNCTIRDDRQMKDCPFEQKRRFIVDLMADLTQEMNVSNTPAQPQGGETSARETVARWKLQSLDQNRNGMLERHEWRDLRKTLKKNKNYPRKCRRQFLRYCDENNDKVLSMEEWRECLGLNHNLFNSLPRDPKRRGKKNPFLDQLT